MTYVQSAIAITLLAMTSPTVAEPAALGEPVRLGFSVSSDNSSRYPGIVEMGEDGCGEVAYLDVTSIPAFADRDGLVAATAVETDSSGKELRRWRLPNSYLIQSLDGEWALASYAGKQAPLWIHTSGRIGKPTDADSAMATDGSSGVMVTTTCPLNEGLQCLSIRDRPAKTRRIVATEPVCS